MKNKCILFLLLILVSCGKNKGSLTGASTDYLEQQQWKNQDEDRDGYINQDELNNGLNPELLNPPNFNQLKLINVRFYINTQTDNLISDFLEFGVDQNYFSRYFIEKNFTSTYLRQLPFQNFLFEKEHLDLYTEDPIPDPLDFNIRPKVDKKLVNFISQLQQPQNLLPDIKKISVSFTLNFPVELSRGPWQKVDGQIQWGKHIIPWHWDRVSEPKINWQLDLDIEEFKNVVLDSSSIKLKLLSWEYLTPGGLNKIDQKYLATLVPFFTLNRNKVTASLYDKRSPLPAAKIVQRPTTENSESLPWVFIKLNNSESQQSSYWLKEITPDEDNWINNGKKLQWSYQHPDNDDLNLPLPPHPLINGLKIYASQESYTFKTITNQVFNEEAQKCLMKFTYPGDPIILSDDINVERFSKMFEVNQQSLESLKKINFYFTFEQDEKTKKIKSLTIHWPENFVWTKFSIKGLLKEFTLNPHNFNPYCRSIPDIDWGVAWYPKEIPLYKSENLQFEWLF